jgi:F420-non-reducing hydrogenase small subunit
MKATDCATIKRDHEATFDPELCFLSQGVICLGSASLDRCLAPCPKRGVPCTGCGGPSELVALEPHRDIRTEVADRMSNSPRFPGPTSSRKSSTRQRPTTPTQWLPRCSGRSPRF